MQVLEDNNDKNRGMRSSIWKKKLTVDLTKLQKNFVRTKGIVYKATGACGKYKNKGHELKLRKGHLQREFWKKRFIQNSYDGK